MKEKDKIGTGTRARDFVRDLGFLTIGKAGGDVFTFILFVVLSRNFEQDGIGQFSFAIGFTGFFAVFAEFGLYFFSVKELSRAMTLVEGYYNRIFSTRVFLSVLAFTALLLVVPFLPFSFETKVIIAMIGGYQVIYTLVDGFTAVFVARSDMHLAGLMEISLRAIIALSAIAVIMAGGDLVMALASFPAATCGQLLLAYIVVTKRYGAPKLVISWSDLTRTFRAVLPYTFASLLSQVATRTDVVFLGLFLGTAAAGVYNVAYRVIFLLQFLPYLAGLAILPVASKLYSTSPNELKVLYRQLMGLAVLIGIPTASGLCLIAHDLIQIIFGDAFAQSASILCFLAGVLFLLTLKHIMAVFLMVCDRQVESTKIQWTGACVSVVGNLLLIPVLGIIGAAVATLIGEVLTVVLFAMRLEGVVGWPRVGSRLIISGAATASFCLPFTFFRSLSLAVVIPVSAILYSATVLLFGEIRKNEFRALLSCLK